MKKKFVIQICYSSIFDRSYFLHALMWFMVKYDTNIILCLLCGHRKINLKKNVNLKYITNWYKYWSESIVIINHVYKHIQQESHRQFCIYFHMCYVSCNLLKNWLSFISLSFFLTIICLLRLVSEYRYSLKNITFTYYFRLNKAMHTLSYLLMLFYMECKS